ESGTPDAYMTEPYNPLALMVMKRPIGHKGFPYWTEEELQEVMPKLVDAGLQMHTHAMGDGSVKHTIDGYINAQNKTGKKARNVIAHVMLVQPVDFIRMAENDIIACVQPTWTAMTKGEYSTIKMALGKKRAEQLYPYGRFLTAGALVSTGTDFPVMPPPDPFIDIQHAMTRKPCKRFKDYENSKDFMLAPKKDSMQDIVGLKDVIKSRTICGAYQSFAEEYTGSIEVGKSADFAILNRNIFETPVEDICDTKVVITVFKGNVVYERD
ncbi:MAG: amidohydrolase family protein, partial [Lachnospiraceae bacterium]